ncbi:MAG: helix-turn-helix transcriptional regulator [Acidimicrobiales bacterium]
MSRPIPSDTRGIIDPAAMMRDVEFVRFPAGDVLSGLVDWFWSVEWNLSDDLTRDQQVLNHPAGNISIGTLDDAGIPLDPAEGRVYGVMTGLSHRHLAGAGWTVAARTTVGGIGALLDVSARSMVDRQMSLDAALPDIGGSRLVAQVSAEPTSSSRVERLRDALECIVARRDPALVAEARSVAEIAAASETDRSIRRVEQLAGLAGVSVRTLQRLFDVHVGVSPSFVIRRWRIIEAAESARHAIDHDGEWRGWAEVAAELGYADQAHLTRDFCAHLGVSPAAYLAQVTKPDDH